MVFIIASFIMMLVLVMMPVIAWFFIVLSPLLFVPMVLATPFVWIVCKSHEQKSKVLGLARQMRVLLVDDDPSSLAILERVLEEQELDFKLITNSNLGAEEMGQGKYDLVILDNDMPELSGPEALIRADGLLDDGISKNQTAAKVIPVIGYSGLDRPMWNLPGLKHFRVVSTLSKGTPPTKLRQDLEGICQSLRAATA